MSKQFRDQYPKNTDGTENKTGAKRTRRKATKKATNKCSVVYYCNALKKGDCIFSETDDGYKCKFVEYSHTSTRIRFCTNVNAQKNMTQE